MALEFSQDFEKSLSGNGKKEPSKSELKNLHIARKSLHINTSLRPGDTLKKEHIICLRPGNGISPMDIDKVIGLQVKNNLNTHSKLLLTDLNIDNNEKI